MAAQIAHDGLEPVIFVSALLAKKKRKAFDALATAIAAAGGQLRTLAPTKDIWARDYMPVHAATGKLVQFTYAPDYLRRDPHRVTDASAVQRCLQGQLPKPPAGVVRCDVTLDGGHVVRLGERFAVSEDVLRLSRNAGRSRADITVALEEALGAPVLWLPPMPDDETGHLDGAVVALGSVGHRVAVNEFTDDSLDGALRSWDAELRGRLSQSGYEVTPVPAYLLDPDDDPMEDGMASAEGLYLNYVHVGSHVLLPQFGHDAEMDARARTALQAHLGPALTVVGVPTHGLERLGGIWHCVTWEAPQVPPLPG